MSTTTATVGWLAQRLLPVGRPVAMALLGVVATLSDGCAGDEEISQWMEDTSTDFDPIYRINHHYVALEAAHPWCKGFLSPWTSWTEQPTISDSELVHQATAVLRQVKWSATEEMARGDLLGQVHQQILATGAGRLDTFDYIPPWMVLGQLLKQGVWLAEGSRFTDLWCGSGTRVMAHARLMQMAGLDSGTVTWALNDPNPHSVALAALNLIGERVGEKVTLRCSQDYAEAWAMNRALLNGRIATRYDLPPDLRRELEGSVRKKRGKR